MAYPPAGLPTDKSNDTVMAGIHAPLHNDVARAVNDIVTELGADPSGAFASVMARLDALPLGKLGYAQVVANQAGITGEVDLAGLAVTVNVAANRRIKITVKVPMFSSVADDVAEVRIKEGAVQLQNAVALCRPANVAYAPFNQVALTPAAGAHTYKVTGLRNAGTGNVTMYATATTPAYILVEDDGPA